MTSQDRVLVLGLPPLAPPVVVAPATPLVLVVPPMLAPPLFAAPPLVVLPAELLVLLFPPVVEPSKVEPPVFALPPALARLLLPPVAPPELDTVPLPPTLLLAPPTFRVPPALLVDSPFAVLVPPWPLAPPEACGPVVVGCARHPAPIMAAENIVTPNFNQALEVGDCIDGLRSSASQAVPMTSCSLLPPQEPCPEIFAESLSPPLWLTTAVLSTSPDTWRDEVNCASCLRQAFFVLS